MADTERETAGPVQRNLNEDVMIGEPTLCIVCAWRQDCQKKYMLKEGLTTRCAEFSKDVTIGKKEKDDTEKGSGHDQGGG